MKRVDEGVAAGATHQHIAAAFAAAEDVVAGTSRQRIVKIATEQLIVACRSHLVDSWIVRHASPSQARAPRSVKKARMLLAVKATNLWDSEPNAMHVAAEHQHATVSSQRAGIGQTSVFRRPSTPL